jgi:hypothetical protein
MLFWPFFGLPGHKYISTAVYTSRRTWAFATVKKAAIGREATNPRCGGRASMNRASSGSCVQGGMPLGFASTEADREADAARRVQRQVLDNYRSGRSGFALCWHPLLGGMETPISFPTAHDEPAVREEAQRVRTSGYLPRPFSGGRRSMLSPRQSVPADRPGGDPFLVTVDDRKVGQIVGQILINWRRTPWVLFFTSSVGPCSA